MIMVQIRHVKCKDLCFTKSLLQLHITALIRIRARVLNFVRKFWCRGESLIVHILEIYFFGGDCFAHISIKNKDIIKAVLELHLFNSRIFIKIPLYVQRLFNCNGCSHDYGVYYGVFGISLKFYGGGFHFTHCKFLLTNHY